MSSPPIKEISAFHPGELYGTSVGSTPVNPMDDWAKAKYHKPEPGELVTAWTGRFMCKVIYDHSRQIWVTNKGTPVKVLMWDKKE